MTKYQPQIVIRNEKEIFIHDFSHLSSKEALLALEEYHTYSDDDLRTERLLLINVTDVQPNKELVAAFKKSVVAHAHRYEKAAVVGIVGVKKILFQGINKFSPLPGKMFPNEETALEWLAEDDIVQKRKKKYESNDFESRYEIQQHLGSGGMGEVYQARHNLLGRNVAVKLLHPKYRQDHDKVERFFREAKAAAAIHHPGIVDVLDVGMSKRGEPFIVMEFLHGQSLDTFMAEHGRITYGEACPILEQVLEALMAAHLRGIVHRDLKPSNIFLSLQAMGAARAKLIDFGVSKFMERDDGALNTATGAILGTPAYMAPEQLHGQADDVDQRTDIYAVGMILFEMLTGKRILHGQFPADPQIKDLLTFIPKEVRGILQKALEIVPDNRFVNAQQFLNEVRETKGFKDVQGRLALMERVSNISGAHLSHSESNLPLSNREDPSTSVTTMSLTPNIGRKRRKGSLTRIIWGLSLLVLAAGIYILAPVAPLNLKSAVPLAATEESVELRITQLPPDAVITYDGMRVPVNPFRVKKNSFLTRLEVQANGHPPFVIAVIPDKDQTIEHPNTKSP